MGRRRTTNRHLPQRMVLRKGYYFHVTSAGGKQKWTSLGKEYGPALNRYAVIEGAEAPPPRTIGEVMTQYLAAGAKALAAETLRGYRQSANRLGKPFGDMRAQDLRRTDVFQYIERSRRVCANRDRAFLSAAYTYALNMGWVEGTNPCHGLQSRVDEQPRRRYIEDAELDRLLVAALPKPFKRPTKGGRTAPPRTLYLMIRFAYLTAMSEGDICRLQLTAATDKGIKRIRQKTGESGVIEWSDELRSVWKEAAGARIGAQPLFRSKSRRNGGHYTPDGVRASWHDIRTKAGLPDVRFHDLRRKAASDVEEGHATALLQHADSKVTKKHYRSKVPVVKPVR